MSIPDGGHYVRTQPAQSQPTTASRQPDPPAPPRVQNATPASNYSGGGRPNDTSASKEPLAKAATKTDQAVSQAAQANETVEALEKMPPARKKALQSEIDDAKKDAANANAAATLAVHDELAVAKQLLSPAHYENYVDDLSRDFKDDSAKSDVVKKALASPVNEPVLQPKPTDPSLAAIQGKADEVSQAESRYATTVEQSRNLPPHIQSLITAGPKAELDRKRAELAQLIQDDLATAASKAPAHPYDNPLANRAQAIAALDPSNKTLQETVANIEQDVALDRATMPAVESINRTYSEKGAAAAAEEIGKQTSWMTPDQAARFIERLDGTIDQISTDLGKSRDNDTVNNGVEGLVRAAEKAGPEATQQIAESLINGFDDKGVAIGGGRAGAVFDYKLNDALASAIGNGAGASLAVATSDALRAAGRVDAAGKIDDSIVDGVEKLKNNFDATQEEYAKLEGELNADLAQFGPGLTADERTAYIKAFWADDKRPTDEQHKGDLSHAEVKAKFESIDEELSSTLATAGPRLESMARAGNERAGEKLLDAYETLARSPQHAEESIAWMNHVKGDTELFDKIDGFINDDLNTRFEEKISTDGVQSMASELLAEMANASDPSEAERLYEKFKTTLDNIGLSQTAKDTIKDTFTKIDEIRGDINELKNLKPGDIRYDKIVKRLESNTKSLLDGFDEKSKFGKSLVIVGIAVGYADSYLAFRDGDIPGGIKDAISATKDTAELGIGVLGILQKSGKVSAEFAEGAAKFGAKVLPLIGLGLDIIQAKDDIEQLSSNPNAGEVIAGIGTLANLASDAIEFIPVAGTLVGAVIGGVGSLIHAAGGFIDDLIEGDQAAEALEDRQRDYLESAGLDSTTANNYVERVGSISLYENFDMSPDAVRNLINREAAIGEDGDSLMRVAQEAAASFGFKGARAEQFFESVLDSPNAQNLIDDGYGNQYDSVFRPWQFYRAMASEDAQTRDAAALEFRTAQADWFKQNMPDVYARYFERIPGAPSYADPVVNGAPIVSYFEDIDTILTGDQNIVGK